MRIALLVAGALPDGLPDYHTVFTAFLRDAHACPFVLDAFDVVHSMAYPTDEQLGTYDALMYTGSAANAFDDVDWINTLVAFTARVIDSHPALKLIAICFGHQIIARALGASCVRNHRWEVGPTQLTLTPLAQSLFATDSLTIQQMHRDHVPSLPPSTLPLASTPTSPIQAFVRFFP
ncbi:putative glutamine amidotransferase-like protein C13C5.04, partial [Termitomyces sp. T112]